MTAIERAAPAGVPLRTLRHIPPHLGAQAAEQTLADVAEATGTELPKQ
ncbi:hypothetical protein [Streptomyces sp. NPDC050704]